MAAGEGHPVVARISFACGLALLSAATLLAQTPDAAGVAYFEKNIRPLLAERCYGCHSARVAEPMSGLRLDTRAGIARGGKSGAPVIVPGKPEAKIGRAHV